MFESSFFTLFRATTILIHIEQKVPTIPHSRSNQPARICDVIEK